MYSTIYDVDWIEKHLSEKVIEFRAIRRKRDYTDIILVILIIMLLLASVVFDLSMQLQIISSIIITLIILLHRYYVIEESILIIRDFGIQLRSKYASGTEFTKFLYCDKINQVFIHESIVGSKVMYQLAFRIHGENKLSLCFRYVYPGLNALQKVFSSIQ